MMTIIKKDTGIEGDVKRLMMIETVMTTTTI